MNIIQLISILTLTTLTSLAYTSEKIDVEDNSQVNPDLHLQEWKTFNINTVDNYIIPGYQALDSNAQLLNKQIKTLCFETNNFNENLTVARTEFHNTMDAWQAIQNIQFGPIQTLMRNYSLQFWPDKKNHVGKHLTKLLNSQNTKALSDAEFHKASVSIKGLPAMERLLFEEESVKALVNNTFHCKVLEKIADYTAQTSHSLVIEWQEMKNQFTDTKQLDGYFEDDIDATTTLLKVLIEPIEVIRDLKIVRPLGSTFGQQKPKRLESWRSERSLRNIQKNIDSLSKFYHGSPVVPGKPGGLNALLNSQEADAISKQFSYITVQISNMASPIERSIESSEGYTALTELNDSLTVLQELLENAVSKQGIHLGFNSRDGD